ncbi:uncharacterized protein DUF202 [Propionibacteriaceae bacterium ES.041]|uniref:DUF202 domain-containing protein n=1 Tax=Enemella evansiae TaxID=2016499 RepID=A0A255G7C4_9ACTN|nr:DUF202 domain-containing protein [Enemella evansiae]PFG66456.1 uncharacterized protein DUF202 [Propionibacteriaceae bacterium ES.041]OYN94372.1 hypothetical protein CGZ96_18650 [Enemella evansiae]OYO04520.1 hypothetical protein CGZ95_04235 [Enemella evansiae]OYO07246.1 hypothetical protein CGZ98_20325 [Enemella evansiae]OYO08754.1 hypothetical protein CGZ94_19800 [Enemella evansiae]
MSTRVPSHDDPGLQPERTTLAWSRTAMALFLVGLLLLRYVGHYGPWVLTAVGLISMVALITSLTHRVRHRRGVHSISDDTLQPPIWSVLLLGGSVGLFALVALIVIVVKG